MINILWNDLKIIILTFTVLSIKINVYFNIGIKYMKYSTYNDVKVIKKYM